MILGEFKAFYLKYSSVKIQVGFCYGPVLHAETVKLLSKFYKLEDEVLLTTKLTGGRALHRLDDYSESLRFKLQSAEVIVFHNSTAPAHRLSLNCQVFLLLIPPVGLCQPPPQQHTQCFPFKISTKYGNKGCLFTFHIGLGFYLANVV